MESTRYAMVVMAVWLGLVIRVSAQAALAPVATASPQAAREIPLYPGAAPGSEKWDWSERSVTTATGLPMVQDVVRPVLLHYPADRDKAVGTAMIVAPGGGFRTLMMSYEGVDIARRLNTMGVDAFVLRYRLLYTGPGAPSRPASGAAGAGRPKRFDLTGAYKAQAGQDLVALAVDDGRQAVRLVRERTGEFGVRPDRVGMMGFSAGGLVTSEALFGPAATRPDFAAIIYGVGEIKETPSPAPPLFLAVAADDALAIDRTVEQFTAYRKGKGAAELHVFQMGAHGFVNKGGGADHFMDRLEEWLVANKLLVKSPDRAATLGASLRSPTAIRLASKPLDDMTERRARRQPTVPSVYAEMPFVETAAELALTPAEKERGYVLFHRPIMEPVYPNTRPLAQERLEQRAAFATPGEFEPLTFSLYPVRELQNLKVRCSSLTCEAGEIPAAAITVRLVTYWNVGYPRYTSRSTYRRTPELLERVSVHSSPRGECQRYWILVHVPDDTKPGSYRGTVSIWDDGFEQVVEIPVSLRVLGFKLQKDPAKHYSAYYYVRNRTQYAGKPESFVRKAAANEYRAMVEYGLDMMPTLYLRSNDGKTIHLPYADELDQMLKAGLTGPIPVTADSIIARFYRDTTPGGEQGSHWNINQLPPPEFYERITAAFQAFESERKTKGWPEFICCPMDEVAAARKEFGAEVYAAVKAAGIRTYATKDPTGADAAVYRPYIDIWCSQPYSVPYEKIIGQDRYEYWCYPNHNAGEIKDRLVMCKGGRMTYGFGFWRSGYTTLIPWHWSWTPGADQFDYLRGAQSGCGQRIDEDGEVIPAVYWECFREGIDDARYIYTLQQAIFQREGSPNAECRRVAAGARKLLQDTWDAIHVQQKYLADGMWPSEEFNTRRWLLAQATSELLQYPAVRTGSAPSVLVTNTSPRPAQPETSIIDKSLQAGNIRSTDLGGASTGLDKYPFFPFCIDWHDAKKRSYEQQAHMLKELGYPGVGHIWLDNVEERIRTLDAAGLKLFQITMAVEVAPAKIPYDVDRFQVVCNAIRGRGVQFCLLLNGMKPSDPTVDAHAVELLRAMSDQAQGSGAQLLLYPHQSSWVERTEDAVRVADKVDRPNVGVMFNLCHWLRVDSRRDYRPLLQRAMPRLWAVSINGADEFDEKPGWERYIQPLDRGSFDVGKLLGTLKELGYKGPIGLQCYGIGGDAREHLARSTAAWQKLSRNLKD